MSRFHTIFSWLLALIVTFIFWSSLPFKFSGAAEPVHIFSTLAQWSGIGLFEPAGRLVIGGLELVAGLLLLIPATRVFGAALGFGILSGAIFFHLFTPLGVVVRWQEGGQMQEDATLFILAVIAWCSCAALLWFGRERLLALAGQQPSSVAGS